MFFTEKLILFILKQIQRFGSIHQQASLHPLSTLAFSNAAYQDGLSRTGYHSSPISLINSSATYKSP